MVGVGTIAIPNGDITAAQRSNEEVLPVTLSLKSAAFQ